MLQRTAEFGLDRHELTTASGFREEDLADPDARVPVTKIWNLWRILIERTSDPVLGLHLGMGVEVKEFGLVGYSMLHSRDLFSAMGRLTRYSRIINEALECRLRPAADHVDVVLAHSPRLDALRHPVDARLAAVLAVARELTGSAMTPIEVRFPYPRPDRVSDHRRYFRSELRFGTPDAELVLRRQDTDRGIASRDEALGGYLDRYADTVLTSLAGEGSFAEQVRRAIWKHLSDGPPTLQQAASALGVSLRTLQRRLREEGTSFAEVLDEFRREMAISLLRDRSLAVYEVAFLLGYSDPSTFYRAFRRWEGVPPQEFRRKAS
jgi:AraC-like DNA-binding protein